MGYRFVLFIVLTTAAHLVHAQEKPVEELTALEILERAFAREDELGHMRGTVSRTEAYTDTRIPVTTTEISFTCASNGTFVCEYSDATAGFQERARLIWDGTDFVQFYDEHNLAVRISPRALRHPEWDMYNRATWCLQEVDAHVRPMRYWFGHVRNFGIEKSGAQIKEVVGEVVTVVGTDHEGKLYEVSIDRAKAFAPTRMEIWRGLDASSDPYRFKYIVEFTDARQTVDGTWYFGRMDATMYMRSNPWETIESRLTGFETPASVEPSAFEISIGEDVEVIDYTEFGHWWDIYRPTFDLDDPLDYTTWPASFMDYSEEWGETAHSFWYAFPDFRGLQFALGVIGLTIAALVVWRIRARRKGDAAPES